MINRKRYLDLLTQDEAKQFNHTANGLALVTNSDEIDEYEKNSGVQIGVVDNQPFFDIRLDLYENTKTKKRFRYCNVSYNKFGAAILVVFIYKQQSFFLLNRQYRPFIHKTVYEIPRGFADPTDKDATYTAIRELAEETNVCVYKEKCQLESLGTVNPDTGLSNNTVSLFMAVINLETPLQLKSMDEDEFINGHVLLTEKRISEMIVNDDITDAFTLAALVKYKYRR